MRALTIQGFLRKYVKELSRNNTTSLYKLAQELNDNPRLKEPLFLYSILTDKQNILKDALKNNQEFEILVSSYDKEKLLDELDNSTSGLREEYRKVWRSYLSEKNRLQSDYHTKELILHKVQELKTLKKISNYRIYTDLKLNHGNINSWLKNGSCDKVSLETARKVLSFTQAIGTHK